MNIRQELEKRITAALSAAVGEDAVGMVAPTDPQFGDYKASGVMAAAKKQKANPRELAGKVAALLQAGAAHDLSDLAEKIEIAGPGFINIKLKKEWLEGRLAGLGADGKLVVSCGTAALGGVGLSPQNIVVDYSAPNLAKEMHVGHLRSTIIGDALARTLEFVGHNVIRQNHVGDWGTQFGMLIQYLVEVQGWNSDVFSWTSEEMRNHIEKTRLAGQHFFDNTKGDGNWHIGLRDLEVFYQQAKKRFDEDSGFREAARCRVVELQSGDKAVRNLWNAFVKESEHHAEAIYARLGISLEKCHIRGESAYNDDLPNVIADLEKLGMLKESQGAQCVFLPQFVAKDGTPLPLIVQKSDEGYLYATTDLAAIRYRVRELHADRILYVVDARQSLHFQMVFATARAAGFVPENVSLEHIAFGTMMGADGKPFKTRTGGTVKLMDLLNEAVDKARELVEKKNAEEVAKGRSEPMSADQMKNIAEVVGIGAVKYADLAQNRNSDYVFSWDKMLAMDGNTAPYLQYAYARIKSIFRKGAAEGSISEIGKGVVLQEPAERALAMKLLQFPEAVATVAADCLPSVLCAYLYDLAGAFTTFYENCPVLKSDEPIRSSRLALCQLTARTIQTGLNLLGIDVIEQM